MKRHPVEPTRARVVRRTGIEPPPDSSKLTLSLGRSRPPQQFTRVAVSGLGTFADAVRRHAHD